MLFLWRRAVVEYIAWKTWLRVHAQLDCWPQPCSVCPTCLAMRDQVYSRGQLLGLWPQAEYSFADVTRTVGRNIATFFFAYFLELTTQLPMRLF